MRVTDSQLNEVREQGFTIVEGFLSKDEVRDAREAMWKLYPRPEDYFANPEPHTKLVRSQFSGLRLFPYPGWGLNRLPVHPDLVDAAERLCGTPELDIYKVELWAKYSGAVNYDQTHHRDYSNHTIVMPKADDDFVQMTTFILLSDVTEEDGPTKVVPTHLTQDVPLYPRHVSAGDFADVEQSVAGPAGTLFIYRTDVMHRASSMTGHERSRFAMLVDFQPRGRPWTGKIAWPDHALSPHWAPAIEQMTPRQRELFGFPAIGSSYWDAQTVRDVALRYPGMDMTPYQETAD